MLKTSVSRVHMRLKSFIHLFKCTVVKSFCTLQTEIMHERRKVEAKQCRPHRSYIVGQLISRYIVNFHPFCLFNNTIS